MIPILSLQLITLNQEQNLSLSHQVACSIRSHKKTPFVMAAVQGAEQMGQMELLLNVYASQKVLITFCCEWFSWCLRGL